MVSRTGRRPPLRRHRSGGSARRLVKSVFAAARLALNLVLYRLFVRPVTGISELADALSLGELSTLEFAVGGSPEIAALGRSLDRRRTSLEKALTRLGGEG